MTTLDDFVIEVLHDLTQASRTRGFINDHTKGYFDGMADAIEIVGKARKLQLEKVKTEESELTDETVQNWLKIVTEEEYREVSELEKKLRYNPGTRAKMILAGAIKEIRTAERQRRNAEEDDKGRWKVKEDE